jgi:molecular chaperone GrpE (heat shock protein)
MLILAELEPYRHLTIDEVMKLQEKQLISDDELRVKLNFANYIRRFERENTNILEFGTQIPYTQKIKVINQKLYDYASEDRQRGEA